MLSDFMSRALGVATAFKSSRTEPTSTVYNPNINSNTNTPWEESQAAALKSTQFDPSSFRTQRGSDDSFNVYSGDTLVSTFQDESSMQDFVSQYSQGWQQSQDAQTPQDAWNKVVENYKAGTPTTPTTPKVSSPSVSSTSINENTGQAGPAPTASTSLAQAVKANLPPEIQAQIMEAVKSSGDIDELMSTLEPLIGAVSQDAIVEAAQADMARESTVQGQLEDLMKSFEGGDPPWATGAMRAANTMMAQRGISSSSMAGQAITNAVMEAALPIAMADANTSAQFQFANLSNLQQARVQNAQSFLQMDLANFNAAQQMQLFKAQTRSNSILSDVAQENASRQFNASSQNQINQFMANLASQNAQFNASQTNAMSQFNAGQSNAVNQFNAQQQSNRQQFNASQATAIAQANAQLQQQRTLAETSMQMQANMTNAQNQLAVSLAEYNNIAQERRDAMNYAFTSSEGAKDRATQIVITDMQQQGANSRSKDANKDHSLAKSAADFVLSLWD